MGENAWYLSRPKGGATRRAVVLGVLTAAIAGGWPRLVLTDEGAAAPIEAFHEGLLGVMREARNLGFAGRAERLAPLIEVTFDHATMTRIACGQAWDGIEASLQGRLIRAFRAYAVASYAANFDDYSGQSFSTVAVEPSRGGRVLVKTEMVRPAGRGQPVPFVYTMHETAAGWQAIDVLAAGRMSELARRRSEFSTILARSGAEELLRVLELQTQALSA
ncbi:MAG: hypothetical protein EA356_16425 [Geminicoccaceae bacterium]|nr:MAG: hypothetical protein EA356_16425 [Geminicoccaceae bacterium]